MTNQEETTGLQFVNTSPANVTAPYTEGSASITIPSGHLLTPHWHPNADEITTCMAGTGTVTIIAPNAATPSNPGTATYQTYPFTVGESVYLQQGYFHYFLNSGTEDFIIDLTFNETDFDILSLNEVMSLLPIDIKVTAINSDPTNPIIPFEVSAITS